MPGPEPGLLEGLCTTRAIRRYRPDPIPEADLAAMLFAATRAPSGANRQLARFLVLRGGARGQAVRALLGAAFRTGWSSKVADGIDTGAHDAASPAARLARTIQGYVDHLEQVPVIVLVCARLRPGGLTVLDGASIYPACQNLLLAARALGYGGVMSVWHMDAHDEIRRAAGIPGDVTIAATVTLGRPEGRHGPVRRRPLGEVVYDEHWGEPAPWAVDPPGTRFTRAGPPPPTRGQAPGGAAT